MHTDKFKIYIDRLTHGKVHKIQEVIAPDFIGIDEPDLKFEKPVGVSGEAYIAEGQKELVLHLAIQTEALMPCAICNEMRPLAIEIVDLYELIPLEEVHGAVFDFRECLREEIILKLPSHHECGGGSCPMRSEVMKYVKTEQPDAEEGYQPFADL